MELAVCQGRPSAGTTLAAIREVGRFSRFESIDGQFAFATVAGVADLLLVLDECAQHWETRPRQRWLISMDFGLTEPNALRTLQDRVRSNVRVMDAAYLLTHQLRPRRVFHAKSLLLSEGANGPIALCTGSGNMTRSGLRFGHEHAVAIALQEPLSAMEADEAQILRKQVRAMRRDWRDAEPITDTMLSRYERLRRSLPARAEATAEARSDREGERQDGLPADAISAMLRDDRLWVETGSMYRNRGDGLPGNQLDLRRGSRAFFGFSIAPRRKNSQIGSVHMVFRGAEHIRHLRFGDNNMDKLDLPALTPAVDYADSVAVFRRKPDGRFGLRLLTPSQAASLIARSEARGTTFSMRGGRRYGTLP